MRLILATLLGLGMSFQAIADHHLYRPKAHRSPYGTSYYAPVYPTPYRPGIVVVDRSPYSSRVSYVRPVGARMDSYYRGRSNRVYVVRQQRRSRRACR
ncbi:MAG: hypothetical protein P8N56_06870 [Schleiferiaceae bacterium]|nr:hypothetical protein [Schleiferiaceae bacterium]